MTPSEPKDPRTLVALSELLRDAPATPTGPELERGLLTLRARMAEGKSTWRARVLRPALVATVLVSVTIGVVLFRVFRWPSSAPARPVAIAKIEGGKLIEGGYLSESGHAGVTLSFNEGSQFRLMPGARGRLRTLSSDGARFAVEHGTASFELTQSHDHRWSVEAGPFLVMVRGTAFLVSWDPQSEQFSLKLRRGRVVVRGPNLGEDLALRGGQNLSVNLRAAEAVITEERSAAADSRETVAPSPSSAPNDAPAAPPATSVQPGASSPSAPASAKSAAVGGRRWNEALARGQWDRILADVEQDGLEATLQSASSEELVALADAARYRRRADMARAALLTQRRRFPGSARALDAVFLLGRLDELRANGEAAAIRGYDQYLALAPAGTYAAEALGRKMILTNALGGPSTARPIADEYLRRFPRGSYAGAAHALRRGP